jgi:glycosyltransferase involved in cell wall biosynthesis
MRIVYLSASGSLGGAETALLNLLGGLRQARPNHHLHVIAAADGPLLGRLAELGVQGSVLPFPKVLANTGDGGSKGGCLGRGLEYVRLAPAVAGYARQLSCLLRELRPNLVHSNGIKTHLLSAFATPRRVPLIWHIHDYVGSRGVTRQLLGVGSCRPSALITNSYSVEEDVRRVLRHSHTQTIYNSIDTARFTPLGAKADLDLLSCLEPAPANTVRVGLMATFAKWKGHQVFLEALSRLTRSFPVRGYVLGAPIYQTRGSQHSVQELREMSARLGLGSRLGFTGFCEDTPPALRALDVVVHASTSPEPFGMVIAEAMACGRAVVASRAGGAPEIFTDEKDGLGHEAGSPGDLARQLERLVRDASLRRTLGERGRASIEKKFPMLRLGHSVAALYEQLTGIQQQPVSIEIAPVLEPALAESAPRLARSAGAGAAGGRPLWS